MINKEFKKQLERYIAEYVERHNRTLDMVDNIDSLKSREAQLKLNLEIQDMLEVGAHYRALIILNILSAYGYAIDDSGRYILITNKE